MGVKDTFLQWDTSNCQALVFYLTDTCTHPDRHLSLSRQTLVSDKLNTCV